MAKGQVRSVTGTAALFLVLACSSVGYRYVPTGSATTTPALKPPGCPFEIITTVPQKPFIELGVVERAPGPMDRMAINLEEFRQGVAEQVCRAGGDAVVAHVNAYGHYVNGTVIRYQ